MNGSARTGRIRIDGKEIKTPFYFPVMSFFCGGSWKSFFGGGPYRAIKEYYLKGAETSHLFDGVITSISQLYDFYISEERKNEYFKKTISEWFDFNGVVFVDSGGYRLLSKNGSTFKTSFKSNRAMREFVQTHQQYLH